MKNTSAYSLIEVTMALAIFTVMIGVVMETLVSMRAYVGHDESVYSLEMEARRVMRSVAKDINTSAWYIPMDPDEKFDLLDPDLDRDVRYYPYVLVQTNSGQGSLFSHWDRPVTEVVTSADFPDNWTAPTDHQLPSQEMVFLKISRGGVQDQPERVQIPRINFDVTPAVPFGQFWQGDIVSNMRLELEEDTVMDVGLYFEADTNDLLREYSYIVRPNPTTGDRELIKAYAHRDDNGQNASTADIEEMGVISRFVDRIVFDTYRTHPGLDVDQVRVELYLSRRNDTGHVNFYKTSMTIAMRSTVDPQYSEHIDSWLGTGGNFSVK